MASNLSKRGCFRCGDHSHHAENCPSEARLCFNCKEEGHESNACPNPKTADSKQCYGCGGIGHLQADCPSLRNGIIAPALVAQQGAGGPKGCYTCGQPGHIARLCPSAGTGAVAARGGRGGFVGRGGFAGRGAFAGAQGVKVVRCYKCGELNHMARFCAAPVAVAAVPAAVPRGPKTCYKCHEEGHIARECPAADV